MKRGNPQLHKLTNKQKLYRKLFVGVGMVPFIENWQKYHWLFKKQLDRKSDQKAEQFMYQFPPMGMESVKMFNELIAKQISPLEKHSQYPLTEEEVWK
jgi:hypothetical protein